MKKFLILILSFLVLYGCSSANPEKYETVQNEEIPLTIHDTILYEETSEKIFTITKLKDKRKIIDEMVLHQNGTEIQPGRSLPFVHGAYSSLCFTGKRSCNDILRSRHIRLYNLFLRAK